MSFRSGVYRHWRGGLYRTLFLAIDSTNRESGREEPYVVYVSLSGPGAGDINVRVLSQWDEKVIDPDTGTVSPRYTFVYD